MRYSGGVFKGHAWREVAPGALERKLEQRCVDLARACGAQHLKLNVLGRRAWPDRLFMLPGGKFLIVEFKAQGGRLTPLQENVHRQLRKIGHDVNVIRSVGVFVEVLRVALDS